MLPNSESTDDATWERILRLAFDGDHSRMLHFLKELDAMAPAGSEVILRGSAVTGTRWADGQPFDADGPGTSDLDITFLSADVLDLFEEFYIPGMHSAPLSDDHPDAAPRLCELRCRLCEIAQRPVNLQASRNLVQFVRDVLFDQPYFKLIDKTDHTESADEGSAA